MVNITETAIGEAIYRLSGNGNYDENNPYNGKIDLVLPDVTEIVAMEFYAAFALNCGQLQTEDTYKPDLENNVWFKPSWGGNVT